MLDTTNTVEETIAQMVVGYEAGLAQAEKIGDFTIPDKYRMIGEFKRDLHDNYVRSLSL